MTDRLGEALASPSWGTLTLEQRNLIVAAARNWHALNEQQQFSWCVTHELMATVHDGDSDCEWVWVSLAVVDAPTVTASPDADDK